MFAVAGVQRDVDNAAIGEPNSDPMHTARRQVDFRPVGGYPGVIITRQFRMKINLRRGEEVVTTAGIYLWSHATRHANS